MTSLPGAGANSSNAGLGSGSRPAASVGGEIAARYWGSAPTSVVRFTTGIGHWVYDVTGPADEKVVVRIGSTDQQEDFAGALRWSALLRPLGVPLPRLLESGVWCGLPYLVLERLPGTDLIQVYEQLDLRQKQQLAAEVCSIQRIVATLGPGPGYGFVRVATSACCSSWANVIEQSLGRSRARIEQSKFLGFHAVDQVSRHVNKLQGYFASIQPLPFLDDVTTKNVLVHQGVLSGIVDVDWICYGDPLFTLALTRTSLLAAGRDLDYTDAWAKLLATTPEQDRAVRFYTALFCADFLSEVGHAFNSEAAAVDFAWVERLEAVLDTQLGDL
jgi:hypothetical protein